MDHEGSRVCRAAGEEPQVGQEDPGSGTGDGGLEVLGEASAPTNPSQAALHHPPPRQELEAFDAGRALDDFDRPRSAIGDGVEQLFAAIDAVGKDMAQLREGSPQRAQQRNRTVRILDVGFVHAHGEQEPLGVGDDMALASLDAFAGVNPARAAAFGRRHALAVDNAGVGCEIATLLLADPGHQPGVDPLPSAVVAPAIEIALHRRARRKFTRQGAPLTAGPQQIQDGVDDRAQVALAGPPQPTPGRQQRRDLRPLPPPRVGWLPQLVTPILLPSGFSPHLVPPSLSANNTESQSTEITQSISGQPLRSPRSGRLEGRTPAAPLPGVNVSAYLYILRCADGSYYVGTTVS